MAFPIAVYDKHGFMVHHEVLNEPSVRSFVANEIDSKGESKYKDYYNNHFKIVVAPCKDVPDGRILWKPKLVTLDRWNDVSLTDPKRIEGVKEVISAVVEAGYVRVEFGYPTPYQNRIAGELLSNLMRMEGFLNFKFDISSVYFTKFWLQG